MNNSLMDSLTATEARVAEYAALVPEAGGFDSVGGVCYSYHKARGTRRFAMWDYGVGDTIEYRPIGGGSRVVVVEERSDEIKNGRPGFSGRQVDSTSSFGVWGYDDQIVRVVARAGGAS